MNPFRKHLKCVTVIKLLFTVKIQLKPYYYDTFEKAQQWNVTDSSFLFLSLNELNQERFQFYEWHGEKMDCNTLCYRQNPSEC